MAALLFRVKPRHVEKFRKYRFADVGKSELGKRRRKKHAQNIRSTVHRTGDLKIIKIYVKECAKYNGLSLNTPPEIYNREFW